MLKYRIITALILIPLVLLALFYLAPPYFLILTALISLAAGWEWSNVMGLKKISSRLLYLLIILLALFNTLFVPIYSALIIGTLWWFFAAALILIYPRGSSGFVQSIWARGLMGLVVLIPCWVAINYIRNQQDGIFALLYLFVLIWGADTIAYFVGRKWGKTKLAPELSPGKSWEGVIAALIYALLLAAFMHCWLRMPFMVGIAGILLSLITVMFSVIGDLFESLLKRQSGLKDSGRLLPGHGGLLDRLDSLSAAAPIFATGAMLIGTYLG